MILLIILVACKSRIISPRTAISAHAQDSIRPEWLAQQYQGAISIESRHIAQMADNYLLDLPLLQNPDSTYVFVLNARVPVELVLHSPDFYPELRRFIVIVPDWKFYNEVASTASKKGMCVEPETTNFYYDVDRTEENLKIDSIRLGGINNPTIDFMSPNVPEEAVAVYRKESYGSVCCPRDSMWDIADQDELFIRDFEVRNKFSVTKGRYVQVAGKEGEKNIYYTLPDLTMLQRLTFLLAKAEQWRLNRAGKQLSVGSKLFTPQLLLVTKTGFTKWNEAP
ncbi:MAG: hypothetical protein LBF27_34640 [Sphingobacterium sp.]|jgi:hypothetical protein|nr:hypothetical protein [Sphingobacterium sp.]